jgi:hypothetical protein
VYIDVLQSHIRPPDSVVLYLGAYTLFYIAELDLFDIPVTFHTLFSKVLALGFFIEHPHARLQLYPFVSAFVYQAFKKNEKNVLKTF